MADDSSVNAVIIVEKWGHDVVRLLYQQKHDRSLVSRNDTLIIDDEQTKISFSIKADDDVGPDQLVVASF